jgi:hypothetical protein
MENGPGRDGRLAAAGGTLIGKRLGIERPGFSSLSFRTDEAFRPSFFKEMASAGRIVGKPRGEGGSRHRTVVFPAARHENKIETYRRAVKGAERYL